MTEPLADFETSEFAHGGETRVIYRSGSGPAVIVISEMPGITPAVAAFADRVAATGLTAVMPHLFGQDGRDPTVGYTIGSLARACVAKEFTVLATGRTSPVIDWLRALARHEHQRCGGPGVGAVGMCFTGGFALGMMVDDVVVAPVLSQPSLPFPITRAERRDVGLSDQDVRRIQERAAAGCQVLGLRFTGDRASPPARFEHLRELLGDAFIGVELDSSPGNPHGHPKAAHSVLTQHLDDRPGTPTRAALDQVLAFFAQRLSV
ncbi:MAG TPA: dienelactone hydrolase family protein [Acidimicrobiales bacterium]|jgi:dienelactone hydrolase|nr:dienelactone hydrolase family protein [Acidimicrobiales bacterium]